MNRTRSNIRALAALLAGLLAATPALAVEFTAEDKAKLAEGKTLKKRLPTSGNQGFYGGTGYTIIEAPVEAVWAAIEDWSSYPKVYPKTVSCTELSRKGNVSLIRMEMGHQLLSIEYHMTVKRERDKNMIAFDLVANKPHDIEDTKGYWRLFPQKDGRTLVAYVVATRVPMGIINLLGPKYESMIERHLLGVPGELKKWMEGPKGAKYFKQTASSR
jgi:ribosome-associated toxin RatA of RatAB toxin-antitoxin module